MGNSTITASAIKMRRNQVLGRLVLGLGIGGVNFEIYGKISRNIGLENISRKILSGWQRMEKRSI